MTHPKFQQTQLKNTNNQNQKESGKARFPTIVKSPKKSKSRSPYVVVETVGPENITDDVVPGLKLHALGKNIKQTEDRRCESTVTKRYKAGGASKKKGFQLPINKHLAKKKRKKSFKFVMDPLRHLKSPNALTPRCNGYDRQQADKKEKRNANPQRRGSMKFTMDPLRHLKTPNVAIKENVENKEQKQDERIQKVIKRRLQSRRPSMRFTLDPLRNLNYLTKLKTPVASSP